MKFSFGALVDFLMTQKNQAVVPDPQYINGTPVKVVEVGVPGTRIYGGYISEDYQGQLHGRQWADKQDQMRRSDAQIRMMLNSLKLPIRSADWTIRCLEETPEAQLQKRLYEKVLFEDGNKSFKRLLGEILTCMDFGYSLLEVTYRAKFNDPDFGTYNTISSLGFRSQRTIERWIVDHDGTLKAVMQIAYGDTGRMVDLDARFLIHFSPDMEGNNYEGISTLRFIYGNWLRKNHYLKLMASGIEKCAIPTPLLTVPAGKENSAEYLAAKKVLEAYTSNQSNYITTPAGWDLKMLDTQFDVEKMKSALEWENQEMMNAALASFLMLGQGKGGGGSHSLSSTLADFFKMSQQFVADHIVEQLNQRLFQSILDMNFGEKTKMLVTLQCEGLAEEADVAFSEILKNLTDAGLIKPDRQLEDSLRDDYGLTPVDESTQSEYAPPVKSQPAAAGSAPVQMSEGKWPRKISKAILKKGFMNSKMS